MKKYTSPTVEMTNVLGNDVIMFSQEPTLAAGEKLMAARGSWFGIEDDGFGE